MKVAIMQPYLFPYIGYFQLINAVAKFVVYDDVSYIKQGWINRNRILVNKQASVFTLPLVGASSFKLIHEIPVADLTNWNKSFFKTIEQNYEKAPFYDPTLQILKGVFDSEPQSVSRICVKSLQLVADYLDLNTTIIETSRVYDNQDLKAQNRVLDICLKENADHYINPIGGTALYSKDVFADNGIQLSFIKSHLIHYKQFNNEFIPGLSIIDVMMFNSPEEIRGMLNQFELV